MANVTTCIEEGRYFDTRHTTERQYERQILRSDVLYVLLNGYHEKRKDTFVEAFRAWNYAIRGKTVDKKDLRVIVSFDSVGMLIVTAIDLDK